MTYPIIELRNTKEFIPVFAHAGQSMYYQLFADDKYFEGWQSWAADPNSGQASNSAKSNV